MKIYHQNTKILSANGLKSLAFYLGYPENSVRFQTKTLSRHKPTVMLYVMNGELKEKVIGKRIYRTEVSKYYIELLRILHYEINVGSIHQWCFWEQFVFPTMQKYSQIFTYNQLLNIYYIFANKVYVDTVTTNGGQYDSAKLSS